MTNLWGDEPPPPPPRPDGPFELRHYDPIQPQGLQLRKKLERAGGVILAIGAAALKFGFVLAKFFSIFIAVGGYALIWGWKFAVGFVLLILVHELGHYVEAKRRGLHPSLPMFIPFFGAYVKFHASGDEWGNGLIALAGPFAGGLGSLAVYGYGSAHDSQFLLALGFTGFLLNAFNLIPFVPFDGGMTMRSVRSLRRAGDPRGNLLFALYVLLAGLLIFGMVKSHVPQHRL
jgi:Zn-dependent protease